MDTVERQQRPASASVRLAASRELQKLFHERLQNDRLHFATLSATLAHAEDSPAAIFDDLSFRAHRLRGMAATFEYAQLAAAAGALERASIAAAGSQAAHDDTAVWETLVALVTMLGAMEDGAPAPLGSKG